MAIYRVPALLTGALDAMGASPWMFLLAVNLLLLVAGSLLEGTTLIVLATPVMAPVAAGLGVDPIHFGLIVIINVVIGTVTPPLGQSIFFASSLTGEPVQNVFRDVLRFLPLLILVLLLVTYVPGVVMWTVPLLGP
jgi:C4-dicarboxylate transporter, DctM subunit